MIEKNTPNSLRHEEKGFTTVVNATINFIQDVGALGIYIYLASKPNDWQISKKQLMNHFGVGRDYINSRFKYLKDNGFMVITPSRDEKGKIVAWETLLKTNRVIQNTENPSSGESRILETQNTAKPHSGQSAPTNKRLEKNKVINNISDICESDDSRPTPIAVKKQPKPNEYIEIWNEIAPNVGCKKMGTEKRAVNAIKRYLAVIEEKWDVPLTPGNFRVWLENAIACDYYLITKYMNPMHVCVRPEHFFAAYHATLEQS